MKVVGNTLVKVTLKCKDKVFTLAFSRSSVKVTNKRIHIDPLTIFPAGVHKKTIGREIKSTLNINYIMYIYIYKGSL